MPDRFAARLADELAQIRADGLWKDERVITSPQSGRIDAEPGGSVLNFCANNYLGLADHPALVAAAKEALDRSGYGMASVRFICGTQDVHKALEARLAGFLRQEDAILYSSCFDANTGLFETLLGPEDAIISDALNHASIIDGVRLCKARRYRYANNDMAELERCLIEAASARTRLIATDGVFSMDGIIANLAGVCELAEKHDALVMVDDSHAVGFVGRHGRGSPEHCGVEGRIAILTGTLGKALGGASGGYTAASREVVALLRQRSRPYLFSNTLMPAIAATSLRVLDLIEDGADLRARLAANARHLPRRDDPPRLHPRRRRPPDHPGDPRRRRPRPALRGRHARPRRLRRRLLLPGGPARPGPHPHPDVRRPHPEATSPPPSPPSPPPAASSASSRDAAAALRHRGDRRHPAGRALAT